MSIYTKECPLRVRKGAVELAKEKRPDLSVYVDMLIDEGVIVEDS